MSSCGGINYVWDYDGTQYGWWVHESSSSKSRTTVIKMEDLKLGMLVVEEMLWNQIVAQEKTVM